MERQKLMAKGAWVGTLKDEQSLVSLKIKPGQTVMLMGTADVVVAPAIPVLGVVIFYSSLFTCIVHRWRSWRI